MVAAIVVPEHETWVIEKTALWASRSNTTGQLANGGTVAERGPSSINEISPN